MYDESFGFIDDDEIVIFIDHIEWDVLWFGFFLIGMVALFFALRGPRKDPHIETEKKNDIGPIAKVEPKVIPKGGPKKLLTWQRMERLLPPRTSFVAHLDFKQLNHSDLFSNLVTRWDDKLKEFKIKLGIELREAEDQLTLFGESNGLTSLSLLIEGRSLPWRKFLELSGSIPSQQLHLKDDSLHVVYTLRDRQNQVLYLTQIDESMTLLSGSLGTVEEILNRNLNEQGPPLADLSLSTNLNKLRSSTATIWFVSGGNVKLEREIPELKQISALIVEMRLSNTLDITVAVEGGAVFQIDQAVKTIKTMLATLLFQEEQTESMGRLLRRWTPKAVIEKGTKPCLLRYSAKIDEATLSDMLDLLDEDRNSFLKRFSP